MSENSLQPEFERDLLSTVKTGDVSKARELLREHAGGANCKDSLGQTPLFHACGEGQLEMAQMLLTEFKVDLRVQDKEGRTAVMVAALGGHDRVVEAVLAKGGSGLVDLKDNKGQSVFHYACAGGNVRLVETLARFLADLNIQDYEGNTPLHVAAACGHGEVVLTLINKLSCNVNMRGHLGRTLLHSACIGGDVDLVKALINDHKVKVVVPDQQRNTPLHMAALHGKEEVALTLINEFKCDVGVKGRLGRSLLHSACIGGNTSLVRTLITQNKVKVVATDNQGNQPLHVAAAFGREEVVLMLLSEFKCDITARGRFGKTLLHAACSGGNTSLVRTLAIEYQMDTKTLCEKGNTPLHEAALSGREEVVLWLINEYQYDSIKGHRGRTLLHSACEGGNASLVRALTVVYRADTMGLALDDENNTPLHVAALCGHEDVVVMLLREFKCVLETKGHLGWTLLHSACSGGNASLVRTLINEHRMDINVADSEGNTAIHIAASCGHERVVLMLIDEFKCDIGVKGNLGRTLLHSACCGGSVSLAMTLVVQLQADLNALDENNHTPLQVAVLHGKKAVAVALINKFMKGDTSLLHTACSVGNYDMVRSILFTHRVALYGRDEKGNTPLHVAALCGQEKVLSLLVTKFDGDISVPGYLGRSLLHSACSGGNVNIVRTLIVEYNMDVDAKDDANQTPLHLASEEVILMLINEKRNLSIGESLGRTLLFNACSEGNVSLVQTLLVDFKIDVNGQDSQNNTPLHVAKEDVALMLLTDFQCDVGAKGHLGRTSLHNACSNGNVSLVKTLIAEHKADVDARDDENNTPLHVAALQGKVDVVSTLLNEFGCDVDSKGHLGWSLLHCACSEGHVSLAQSLIHTHKANVLALDNNSNTPLHVAALCGRNEAALMLYEHDASASGHLGRSVIHSACSVGNIGLVRLIASREQKVDFTAQDIEDNTPLHVAALCGEEEMALALIDQFHCDSAAKGYQGRSLLHSACAGGNVALVKRSCKYISLLVIDSNGDTPLHICAALGHVECVRVLLSNGAPILIRNNSGKTPLNVATGEAKDLLGCYMQDNKDKIYHEYDIVQEKAKEKYSGAEHITRIFVIGNPGAGKSSLVETLKRENWLDYFRPVSESSVPRHTAGIIPSIYRSKHYGRVLFYDFAGDPEYYSSHAAILESLASSNKGDNIFLIVVDLREDSVSIRNIITYWTVFIQNQSFKEKKSSFIVVGSHLDELPKANKNQKIQEFKKICESSKAGVKCFRFSYFMLNCCKPQSTPVINVQKQIVSLTKDSPLYKLSPQAIMLLGLLEKDFHHVVSCSIQNLLSHINDTGINLPADPKSLYTCLCELQDIGLLLVISSAEEDKMQIVLNISRLTNQVHKLLFSKGATAIEQSNISTRSGEHVFNVGIIPENILKQILPEYVTKECLVKLQYCQEIGHKDISIFPTASVPNLVDPSFLFFPALCTAQKSEVSWSSPLDVKYRIGWLAQCAMSYNCFPPRFLHVLLLRLVFRFTLSAPPSQALAEHRIFKRRCTMWSTGVHWLMEEGVECMIELVDTSKAVAAIVKGGDDAEKNHVDVFREIVDCVVDSLKEFCHTVKYDTFFLDSTSEADYFNTNNMFSQSDLDKILASPENKTVTLSVSGKGTSSRILQFYKTLKDREKAAQDQKNVSATNGCEFSMFESSLPPVVRPYLEEQIDWDSDVDANLCEIAEHMLDWDSKLVSPLKLSEADISDIKQKFSDPELQRRAALQKWKNSHMLRATYRNLLQAFIDAECTQCADAVCKVLRKKEESNSIPSAADDFAGYVSSLPSAVHPFLEHELDEDSEGLDNDLNEIAHHMVNWEVKLSSHLKLTEVDISDVKEKYSTEPELQRREALRRWKNKEMQCCTYKNLLRVFVNAGHRRCADTVCGILRRKCTYKK